MNQDIRSIYRMFGGKLVGRATMKTYICEVLARMPEEVISYVSANCWFFGSMDDAWAFTFTGNDLKDKHLIFLSDELMMQDMSQIRYTIAHEIGHVILRHRNSTLVHQSKGEVKRQEREADAFAKKYI